VQQFWPYSRSTAAVALVLARQLCHRLAGRVPFGDMPALAGVQGQGSAEFGALALGAFDAFLAAFPDQFAFKFGNP